MPSRTTRLALAATLLCCAQLAADERAPHYSERTAGQSAPAHFRPSEQVVPLDSTRSGAEQDRYPRDAGVAHKATLQESHNLVTPRSDGHSAAARAAATSGPLPISRPNVQK